LKKTIAAVLTILMLSIIITCGAVSFANANPIWMTLPEHYPTEPNYSKPTITIQTPIQNATYEIADSNTTLDLPLNFTITKPNGTNQVITSLWYAIDDYTPAWFTQIHGSNGLNQTKHNISPNDTDKLIPTEQIIYNLKINATNGTHILKIGLEAKSYYLNRDSREWVVQNVKVNAESDPITFTVVSLPPPTPTPTATPTPQIQNQSVTVPVEYVLLAGLAVFAVVAPILLFRKTKKRARNET
jgi:hypothetical protein